MFLDCLTETAGDLRAEMVRLQRQITELAWTRSSAISVPSGTVTDIEQSSDPTARIMSISRMSEGLSKALTFMRRAHTFPHGIRVLSPSSIASHPALHQSDQVSVLRTKIGRTASKSMEANAQVQTAKTTVELLDALEMVFKPRDIERTRCSQQHHPDTQGLCCKHCFKGEAGLHAVQLCVPI